MNSFTYGNVGLLGAPDANFTSNQSNQGQGGEQTSPFALSPSNVIRDTNQTQIGATYLEEMMNEIDFDQIDEEYRDKDPYHKTIRHLLEMQWIQCPIQKLDHVYNCLKFELANEIDEFYSSMSR